MKYSIVILDHISIFTFYHYYYYYCNYHYHYFVIVIVIVNIVIVVIITIIIIIIIAIIIIFIIIIIIIVICYFSLKKYGFLDPIIALGTKVRQAYGLVKFVELDFQLAHFMINNSADKKHSSSKESYPY